MTACAYRLDGKRPMETWRTRLAALLTFAAAVVIGIMVAVVLGGIVAGVVG